MCIYINEKKGKLYVLELERDSMVQRHVFELYSASKYEVSVVDNVLVVHNMLAKLAILFDVRTDSSSALAAPLPIAYDHYEQTINSLSPTRNRAHCIQDHKYENWSFLPERYVLDNSVFKEKNTNSLWTMQLDLQAIVHSWPSTKRALLVDFLLKRREGQSKALLLDVLFHLVYEGAPLPTISRLFALMHAVAYEARKVIKKISLIQGENKEKKTSIERYERGEVWAPKGWMGYQVISQEDLCESVFQKCIDSGLSPRRLTPYMIECIRSAIRQSLRITPKFNMMLVDFLIMDKRFFELHQFLQYHVLQDSTELASILISLEKSYEPAFQLGLDMLYRLTEFTVMMRVLLSKGQVLAALQLVPHTSAVFREKGLKPRDFLKKAVADGKPSCFFTTFRFFQARNQALRGFPDFLANDACEEFTTMFHANFRGKKETLPVLLLPTGIEGKETKSEPDYLVIGRETKVEETPPLTPAPAAPTTSASSTTAVM
uniref:Mic1 domain-containing protein n=1 Tax=Amorphochlora amoebiformis TaxID=1561963 RepID=A0A7S0CXT4_9EUKA